MEPITLAGQIRTTSGKGPNRRLRSSGPSCRSVWTHVEKAHLSF